MSIATTGMQIVDTFEPGHDVHDDGIGPHLTEEPLDRGLGVWATAAQHFLRPIARYLADESVTEIMVNGPDQVFIERAGQIERTDAAFQDESALTAAATHIAQFVGRRVTRDQPILDGRLPAGHRVSVVLPPIASAGATITIRKFSRASRDASYLVAQDAISQEGWTFLAEAVRDHANILISGGTGTGKTTVLGTLASTFALTDRVIVLEDTRELQLGCPHVVRLEARPADRHGRGAVSIRDLFVASLRMRPDRLIVGEVRGAEALDMIQAMTSGHRGSLSTLHANSPIDACHRLETMALLAGLKLAPDALRRQIESAIDLVVQLSRGSDGHRRVVAISRVHLDAHSSSHSPIPLFERERGIGPLRRVHQ